MNDIVPNWRLDRWRHGARSVLTIMTAGWVSCGSLSPISQCQAAGAVAPSDFAAEVVSYDPGSDFAVDFQSGLGYTNTVAVLGAPSRTTPGDFGGPVHPMNPPFLRSQLLSVGDGGHCTVRFGRPIYNHPANPFGLDFIVHSGEGFIITNNNFEGGGITDGSLFGATAGDVRVSVSDDNQHFFPLDPDRVSVLDGYYPTDGGGMFGIPADPSLTSEAFSGHDLEGIRSLYGGSAGGAGFDLDWAVDDDGNPVALSRVRYVRIESVGDKVELDGIVVVTPPGSWVEDFSIDPLDSGWQTRGMGSLFEWSEAAESVQVTWDTELENSFLYRPLGTIVTSADDFEFSFDLNLSSLEVSVDAGYAFELAVGLIRMTDAFQTEFRRGTGVDSPNLIEWNYFPDTGFGATISPAIVSGTGQFAVSFNFPLELSLDDRFHIAMRYGSAEKTLTTTMLQNGQPFSEIKPVILPTSFTDFAVDAFSISSYTDDDQQGSIVAHGAIDNVVVSVPPPPIRDMHGNSNSEGWTSSFRSRTGWIYQLERSERMIHWQSAGIAVPGTGETLALLDSEPPANGNAFYRIRAERTE